MAGLTVDLSRCLVAYAGEVVTCPECGAELAVFSVDATGPFFGEAMKDLAGRWSKGRLICACGAVPWLGGDPYNPDEWDPFPHQVKGPRLHLSTGWRDLGGE